MTCRHEGPPGPGSAKEVVTWTLIRWTVASASGKEAAVLVTLSKCPFCDSGDLLLDAIPAEVLFGDRGGAPCSTPYNMSSTS